MSIIEHQKKIEERLWQEVIKENLEKRIEKFFDNFDQRIVEIIMRKISDITLPSRSLKGIGLTANIVNAIVMPSSTYEFILPKEMVIYAIDNLGNTEQVDIELIADGHSVIGAISGNILQKLGRVYTSEMDLSKFIEVRIRAYNRTSIQQRLNIRVQGIRKETYI